VDPPERQHHRLSAMTKKKHKKTGSTAPGHHKRRGSAGRVLRSKYLPYLIVFAVAFLARFIFLEQIRTNPFFNHPLVDCGSYLEKARSIAAGDWMGGPHTFWQAPLYPYLLALLLKLSSGSLFWVRVIQIVFGSLSCVLTFAIAERYFPRRVAIVASGVTALYGPLLFFDSQLLIPFLFVFLSLLLLLVLESKRLASGTVIWIAAGLLLGLAALARTNILVMLPAIAIWVFVRPSPGKSTRAGITRIGLLVLGCVVAIAPVTVRNYVLDGNFVLVSYNAGINFFLGNNADYKKTVLMRPGFEWERLIKEPALAGEETPGDHSKYFFRKSFAFIRSQPARWVRMLLEKTWHLTCGNEIMRNHDPYLYRQYSPLLRVLMFKEGVGFPFGVLLPASVLGLVVSARSWRRLSLLYAFVLFYSASVIAFFVTSRYRVPLVPVLAMFAASGVFWLIDQARLRSYRKFACGLVLLAGVGVISNCDLSVMTPDTVAEYYYNLGKVARDDGNGTKAIEYLKKALARQPDMARARYLLCLSLEDQGRFTETADHYKILTEAYPERAHFWDRLAGAQLRSGKSREALENAEKAVRLDPEFAHAYLTAGSCRLAIGEPDRAIQDFLKALELNPNDLDVMNNLGVAYAQTGDFLKAREMWEKVVRLNPTDKEANRNLRELKRVGAFPGPGR